MRLTSVDFAEPVPPMMPMVSPLLMCRSMLSRAWRSAFLEYLKLTSSKSMEPSATWVTGWPGLAMVGVACKTSLMRCALSSAMVTMTKIMESCMRLIRIWKPYVNVEESWPTSKAVAWLVMMSLEPR